jgi:DNA-binding NarL/FixJ family response regulator
VGQLREGERVKIDLLTPRQRIIAALLADGFTQAADIAKELNLCERTVKSCLYHIYQRLDIRNDARFLQHVRLGVWWHCELFQIGLTAAAKTSEPEVAHRTITPRQLQAVELLARRGLTNQQIAQELGIRPGTVKFFLGQVFALLNIPTAEGFRGRQRLTYLWNCELFQTGMRELGLVA